MGWVFVEANQKLFKNIYNNVIVNFNSCMFNYCKVALVDCRIKTYTN